MDPVALSVLVGGAAVAAAGRVLMHYLSDDATTNRLLRRERTYAIERLEIGTRAKIEGRVELVDDVLRDPVFDQPCAGYEIRASLLEQGIGGRWVPLKLHDAFRLEEFDARDDTGVCRVRGRGSAIVMVRAKVTHEDRELLEFLFGSCGPERRSDLAKAFEQNRLRAQLRLLESGDRVSVHGFVSEMELATEASQRGSYRMAPTRPVLGPNAKTGLYISNHPAAFRR